MEFEPVPHREPEVKVLGALATVALQALRVLFFAAGAASIGGALWTLFDPHLVYSTAEAVPPLGERIATNATFVCFGLPLVLPHRWTFERGPARAMLLAIALVLVVAPMLLEQNPLHFLVRVLACGVGCMPVLVWRLLWNLR